MIQSFDMSIVNKELFPIEIREDLLKEGAKKAFEQGASLSSLLKKFTTSVYPTLIKRIESLETNASVDLFIPLFLEAKREYFEAKAWIHLNLTLFKEVKNLKEVKEEKEIDEILERQWQRIDRYRDRVIEIADSKFPQTYEPQLLKIEFELDKILIGSPEKLSIYTQEQREIYFGKIAASKKILREMAAWIVQRRPQYRLLLQVRSADICWQQLRRRAIDACCQIPRSLVRFSLL